MVALGTVRFMSDKKNEPSIEVDEPPNLRPGPTEQGGHGGMATREQEARIYRAQSDDAESSD
jgi:hypothetical protein